jgi:metal-dependent amidase/aminoacylase/carboxypeptidase family protein
MTPLGRLRQRRGRSAGYRTHHADLHLGGEDFAVYLQHIPGAFVSIGSASELVFTIRHLIRMTAYCPAAHYFARWLSRL